MKKAVKILVGLLVVLVVLVLVVVLTLPLTINPLVKTAASSLGPKVLGAPVSVEKVSLNPFAGRLVIARLVVGNPPGYSDKPAFAVDTVDVDLKMTSLLGDVIVVEKIQVDAPAISYETKEGAANFDVIQANAKKSSEADTNQLPAEAKSAEKKPGKKVIIDLFELNGAKVSYASGLTLGQSVTLPLPAITLRDIGKDSGGASFVEAIGKVLDAIVGGLGQAVAAAAGQAGDLLKGAAGTASDAAQGAADTASDAAQSVGAAAGEAAKGVSDAASDAADTVKNLFK